MCKRVLIFLCGCCLKRTENQLFLNFHWTGSSARYCSTVKNAGSWLQISNNLDLKLQICRFSLLHWNYPQHDVVITLLCGWVVKRSTHILQDIAAVRKYILTRQGPRTHCLRNWTVYQFIVCGTRHEPASVSIFLRLKRTELMHCLL